MLETDIRRLIGEPTYSRGSDYFRQGKVIEADVATDAIIEGEVSGSGRRVYSQDIELIYRRGKIVDIEGDCSCPVGYNCKHIVAVMLAVRKKLAPHAKPRDVTLPSAPKIPGNVELWLSHLKEHTKRKPESTPNQEQLYYLFHADGLNRPGITPYKVRLLKSGEISKTRKEYNPAYAANGPKFIDLADTGILQKLNYLLSGYPRRYEWPEGPVLFTLLREIIATGRARAFELDGPELQWAAPRPVHFEWVAADNGTQRIEAIAEDGNPLALLSFTPPVYFDRKTGACGEIETALPPALASLCASAPDVPAHAVPDVNDILHTSAPKEIPRPTAMKIVERKVKPQPVLQLFTLPIKIPSYLTYRGRDRSAGQKHVPVARLSFDYAGQTVKTAISDNPTFVEDETLIVLKRDSKTESEAINKLEDSLEYDTYLYNEIDITGPITIKNVEENDLIFPPEFEEPGGEFDSSILRFSAQFLPELRREGWRIDIDESWPIQFYEGSVDFEANTESSGVDWFSLALTLQANGEEVDLVPAITMIINALPVDEFGDLKADFDIEEFLENTVIYPSLADGRIVPVTGEWLAPVVRAFLEVHGLTGFHLGDSGRLAELATALEGCGIPWQGGQEILELGKRLRALTEAQDAIPPSALKAELRPYQRTGYGWLKALSETGFGGALTDDMGLGKTVQALALLVTQHVENHSDQPSLLVVPTSLIGNWRNEVARFAPDLSFLILHGADRKNNFDAIPKHDVIITTYPLVHRDHETLFKHEYNLVILDEAQAIKNPASSIAKRIRDVRARHRIALTGTPVENNLIELWALFDWLIPGLLGNRASFTKTFRTPIEKHGDKAKQKLLSTRLKPFLLRRTKEEVADDLPPKTIIDEIVPLTDGQRSLYETLRVAMDSRVKKAIAQKGLNGSRITILDALLKLRQACCDPSLVKLEAARKVSDSAKRTRLMMLLEELVAEGRKVLVFSQFVGMLKLLEQEIQARGWGYSMLTGKSKKREDLIKEFQEGDNQLFLISLKAGGVGLNLTTADTVVLYDPWWNPAVERQAMDRAHRIGQTKPVFVYRMIAEGTVEAAIQTMQATKQSLADALFDDNKGGPLALDEDDITALFAPLE